MNAPSAFDIAGAVVWTPLALRCGWVLFAKDTRLDGDRLLVVATFTLLSGLSGAFCIARLMGAQA